MNSRENAIREIESLVVEGQKLVISIKGEDSEDSFRVSYQKWYTRALKAVEFLAQDRYHEFKRYYEPNPRRKDIGYGEYVIQDFIKSVIPNPTMYPGFDAELEAAGGIL